MKRKTQNVKQCQEKMRFYPNEEIKKQMKDYFHSLLCNNKWKNNVEAMYAKSNAIFDINYEFNDVKNTKKDLLTTLDVSFTKNFWLYEIYEINNIDYKQYNIEIPIRCLMELCEVMTDVICLNLKISQANCIEITLKDYENEEAILSNNGKKIY